MKLGIDAGAYEVKVCTMDGCFKFLSTIGEYRDRKLTDSFGPDDMIWEYNGEKGFAGTLAFYESEFGGNVRGNSKLNNDAKMRILLAIHRYGAARNKIIVGQPIETHVEEEKEGIKKMLKGSHTLILNGVKKTFKIDDVEIAPEGPSAALSQSNMEGLVRIIDIGSGTMNYATLRDFRRIDKDSFTESIGMETTKNKDLSRMAERIYRTVSSNWDKNEEIYLAGGGASKLIRHLMIHLPNVKLLKPQIFSGGGSKILSPEFANAVGFYHIAEKVFDNG